MKKIIEIREIESEKIKEILYFEDEKDVDKHCKKLEKFERKEFYVLEKGESVPKFRKELIKINALNKLTKEEKIALGLI